MGVGWPRYDVKGGNSRVEIVVASLLVCMLSGRLPTFGVGNKPSPSMLSVRVKIAHRLIDTESREDSIMIAANLERGVGDRAQENVTLSRRRFRGLLEQENLATESVRFDCGPSSATIS